MRDMRERDRNESECHLQFNNHLFHALCRQDSD